MNKNLIKTYIEKIEKKDILEFAKKENIILSDNELNLIYNAIKKDTDTILSSEFSSYILQFKDYFSEELYNLIIEKYNKYKFFIE